MTIARPKNSGNRSSPDVPTRLISSQSGGGSAGSRARQVRDSAGDDLPVAIGEVIDSKYRVDRLVGTGGMGIVMAAHDVMLDRQVAVKFLHGLNSSTDEANSRFKREARAMAKLHSEHVVHVLDVGTLPSGEPYMVMEYLEGTDLAALVKQKGFLQVTEAVDYILSACEAVAEAHTQGIIHRDLKPSNLYLAKRRDGTSTLKLLDFGIAKIATDTSEYAQSFTTTTALLGSPVYMSPEQLQCSRDADARADIWSLGAIVYRLVSGRPPFAATTMPQLCTLIMTTAPQPLVQLVADIPPGLDAVVLRCLEKNADDRFENVAELARALSPFGSGRSQVSVERAIAIVYSNGDGPPDERLSGPVVFPPAQPSGPSIVSARDLVGISSGAGSVRELAEAEPPGSNKTLWAALIISLVLGFSIGMYWLRGRTPPPPPDEGSFATPPVATAPPPVTAASPPPPAPLPAPAPLATQAVAPVATQPAIPVSSLPTAPNAPARNPRQRPPPGRSHVEPRIDQLTFPAPPAQASPPAPAPPPPVAPAAPGDNNSEFGGRK